MKHKPMLQKICHADELSNISPDLFKDDKALLSALIDDNICMVLDYKYENPKDVAEFIKHRLYQLALKEIELSFEHLENDFEQSDDDNFIEFMLSDFNKQIKKISEYFIIRKPF
ncbi:Uncharacterised protein [Moraxella lacunata]|uniref:Uncharacterized protein n=1 Tax=Moraxella lacunata TaxID=477 RepID=A0A378T3S4_MORLA|nr:hypothetical protein [Moraxella lacunata]STZ55461.1 Uncharacterised protein [Moraxella lacunata]